jgi:hypothetical protein
MAGISGGLALVANALSEGFFKAESFLLGLALISLCEIGLVRELGHARHVARIVVSVVLLPSGIIAIMGLYSLLTAGAVVGVALTAVGALVWILAAPVVALACAQAGLVGLAPAVGLTTATLLFLLTSVVFRGSILEGAMGIAWALAWAWVGLSLFRASGRGSEEFAP